MSGAGEDIVREQWAGDSCPEAQRATVFGGSGSNDVVTMPRRCQLQPNVAARDHIQDRCEDGEMPLRCRGGACEVPVRCHSNADALPMQRCGDAMPLCCGTIVVPTRNHSDADAMPMRCRCVTMRCRCDANAVLLSRCATDTTAATAGPPRSLRDATAMPQLPNSTGNGH